MTVSSTILGDLLGDSLGDKLGSVFGGPLMRWSNGTFANASTRYLWDVDGKVLYGAFAGGIPATAFIGNKERLQMEGARTNNMSLDFDGYGLRGTAVVTASQPDPNGGSTAFKMEGLNTGANDANLSLTGVTADAFVVASVWVKRISTTGSLRIRYGANSLLGDYRVDLSMLSDDWERVTDTHPAVSVVNVFQNTFDSKQGLLFGAAAAGALDVFVYQAMQEEAAFTSSLAQPATTRAADAMSFASVQIPEVIRSGAWSTELTVEHSDTDLATSDVHYAYYVNATNYLAIEEDGLGAVQAKLATTSGNLVKTITYSSDQVITLTPDFVAGELTVAGATTGDGTVSGTVSAWPAATLHIGSDSTPANHLFGTISEPVTA